MQMEASVVQEAMVEMVAQAVLVLSVLRVLVVEWDSLVVPHMQVE
jgi:hypothetical protein